VNSDTDNEQAQVEFLPAAEEDSGLRQRRRQSSLSNRSNRSNTPQTGGIGQLARNFFAE
jgi:hypothetical protein